MTEQDANREYASIGGFAGLKAYVRGKWEATQYILDKADMQRMNLFRTINIPGSWAREPVEALNGYDRFTKLEVKRNGAASTSVSRSVCNEWDGSMDRVVLRAIVPRTAAV